MKVSPSVYWAAGESGLRVAEPELPRVSGLDVFAGMIPTIEVGADFCEETLAALSAMSGKATVVPLDEGKREKG